MGLDPVFVVVWMRDTSHINRGMALRSTGDSQALTVRSDGTITYVNVINSLDTDGFNVRGGLGGSIFQANVDGAVYSYVALGA